MFLQSAFSFYAKTHFDLLCGVDEAGRGPIAGPVVASAVILDPSRPIEGLMDSKKLTEKRRRILADIIRQRALAWSVAESSIAEIDELNILQASLLAMKRAVEGLTVAPSLVLIDGNKSPVLKIPVQTIVGGDSKVDAIAAASILAKTARDEILQHFHVNYPDYGFDRHKGYPTALHLERMRELGVLPVHRKSFAPVRLLLSGPGDNTLFEELPKKRVIPIPDSFLR